jgi:hypothetical protein
VIVTGSNIPTAEEVGPNPVDTYRQDDITKLGIRTSTDLVQKLPAATGASINPARTFGPMFVQQLAGGTVKWSQLPVYLLAELAAGALAGLAYAAVSRSPARAVAPAASVPAKV